jgi:hypothetical protein
VGAKGVRRSGTRRPRLGATAGVRRLRCGIDPGEYSHSTRTLLQKQWTVDRTRPVPVIAAPGSARPFLISLDSGRWLYPGIG